MIRHAKPSEIDEIMQITRACAVKMVSENIFQWNEHYPTREAFQKDLSRNELYVLLDLDEIVGCIVISSEKDVEYNEIDWLTVDSRQYYIHRLAIHPNSQGKGYAKKLMDFAEGLAVKNDMVSVRLDTFSQNKRNQKFYETRRYQRLGNIYFPKQSKYPFYCYELILNS